MLLDFPTSQLQIFGGVKAIAVGLDQQAKSESLIIEVHPDGAFGFLKKAFFLILTGEF